MRRTILFLALLIPSLLAAQGVRYSATVTQQGTIGTVTNAVILPANPQIAICIHPANAVPCTNKAITYQDQTLAVACLTSTQIVRDGTSTCVASPDAQNNFGFWAPPNSSGYDWTVTLPGGVNLGPFNVLSQTNIVKQLNGMQFADQYTTTSAVGNPVALANIAGSATGGSVASNTYACEITYNGATSGQTQASPTSGTITTSGAASQLSCAPGDEQTGQVPAGALTYNVYWQTGGAGSYWLGHSNVALTTTDIQTTTPATSGTNPPGSNTALATLPTAQAALGGNPGTLIIPSTEPANSGWPGTPVAGQTLWDQRNAAWLVSQNAKIPNQISTTDSTFFTVNQTNPLLNLNVNNFNQNAGFHETQFSTNTQFAPIQAALNVGIKTTAGANAFGLFGISSSIDTFNPGQGSGGSNSVAIYSQNVCRATNCHIWAMNPLILETAGFRPEYANTIEADYNNNSGTDATAGQALIEDGIDIISGGTNHPRQALTIVGNIAADYWQEDIVAQNYQTNGIRLQAGAVGAAGIYYVPPANDSNFAINGRNTANSATVWFMHNDGGFQAVINSATAWFADNSGCTTAASGFYRNCSADAFVWRNNANTADLALSKDTNDRLTWPNPAIWPGIHNFPGNTAALTADWTCGTGGTVASCTSATIIGSGGGVPLTFTLPLATQSYTLECDGVVGQATAATANQWNLLTATNGATNVTANYSMATAATAAAYGAVTDQASTTTTFNIAPAWTLGGTGTKMPFHIWAKIEGASASGTVLSLQLLAPTVGDLVTIYRGTACRIF